MGFFDKLKHWGFGGHHRKHKSDKGFQDKGRRGDYYYDNRNSDNFQPKTSMRCSNCGNLNIVSSRFCQSCGDLLAQTALEECSKCGASLAPSARFCMQCGQKN